MTKYMLFKKKIRFLYEENIYFTAHQAQLLLGVSESCFSKQLRRVAGIPGCDRSIFRTRHRYGARKKNCHRELWHYNLNTVVAIAYRVNNKQCRIFLSAYHKVLKGLHMRVSGTNFIIPTIAEDHEFLYYANRFCPPLDIDYED